MHYDFIEIGAYCHDTLVDTANHSTRGILVEPIKEYLDRIHCPFPLISKVNAAIVDKFEGNLLLYYVPENKVKQYRLHNWITQCNSIGKPHPWHINYFSNPDGTGECTNLMKQGIVQVRTVPAMTYGQLLAGACATSVDFLKIDTEGFDCKIVNSAIDSKFRLPRVIQFETNGICPIEEVEATKARLTSLGYTHRIDGANTISTLV